MFSKVEDAYNEIAKSLLDFPKERQWDKLILSSKIYQNMASISKLLVFKSIQDNKSKGWSSDSIDPCGAALFLRDNLLATTGARIWGLTFTLHPTGKFEIEYDYNKPEGYEETDEIISGIEINQSLNKLKNN